ncbi:unnamed protein product [Symbiodinium natans]|uniref:Uncharacterized protein n=1 Tax=Symbiodinium natans TaxID=878477 RepID=A0A812N143_9DINO|nr:unnamed protein product [Symbiodinium natans]
MYFLKLTSSTGLESSYTLTFRANTIWGSLLDMKLSAFTKVRGYPSIHMPLYYNWQDHTKLESLNISRGDFRQEAKRGSTHSLAVQAPRAFLKVLYSRGLG